MDAVLGYCTKPTLEAGFVRSLLELLRADERFDGNVIQIEGPPMLADLRAAVVRRFLLYPVEWLLMVDTDVTFTKADVDELFRTADPTSRPIVSGIYRSVHDRLSCSWRDETGAVVWPAQVSELPTRDGLCEVEATGLGFVLVHRGVFEGFTRWFDHLDAGTELLSEDASFCIRAREAGFPIYVNPAVRVGHIKATELVA